MACFVLIYEWVVRILCDWNIRIDELFFLGGLDKGVFLKVFGVDVFFDDQEGYCWFVSQYVVVGYVFYGIVNRVIISEK